MKEETSPALPAVVLVVIHPFADYQRGQRITAPDEIQAVLDGENSRAVVKTPAE